MPAEALRTTVKHYAWGSPTVLPALLGVRADGQPQAELWVGAHPDGPSLIERGGRWERLDEVIARDPVGELGAAMAERFGPRLPFLLKILTVARPLSIQAHPDADQAEAGFRSEERAGIPREAPHRRYRDPLPKPEMLCALTPFRVLSGLRPVEEGAELLTSIGAPEAAARCRSEGYRAALRWLFRLDSSARQRLVGEAAGATSLVADLAARHPGDIGCVVAMLLHDRTLTPGQGLYLPAGILHAYLSGTALEVQANSDTVLRAGLTSKPVDHDELLSIVEPEPSQAVIVSPDEIGMYRPPTTWFQLQQLDLHDDVSAVIEGPALLLSLEPGLSSDGVELGGGGAAWLRAGATSTVGGGAGRLAVASAAGSRAARLVVAAAGSARQP